MLRVLRRRGLVAKSAGYQRERRQLAAARRAAFLTPPTGPLQVWQLDFSEFETHGAGVWRFAGCNYWSKYEFGWHLSPTGNQHDAIAAIELARTEAERLAGRPLSEELTDPATQLLRPIVVVTDNGGPFRAARFAGFINDHPELTHVRIKNRSPGDAERRPGTRLRIPEVRTALPRRTSPTATSCGPTQSSTAPSSTTSGPTKRCPGTDPSTSTSATPTPPNPTIADAQPADVLADNNPTVCVSYAMRPPHVNGRSLKIMGSTRTPWRRSCSRCLGTSLRS